MKRFLNSRIRSACCCGLLAAAVTALSCACSDDEAIGGVPEYQNSAIAVGTSVGMPAGVATRAFADTDHEALKTGTNLRLKVSGKWVGHNPDPAVATPFGTAAAEVSGSRKNAVSLTAANQFYWDDFGTGDPVNQAGRDEGLTVLAIGVNDGVTAAPAAPADWTDIAWSVERAGTNVLTKDLIFSNNVQGVNTYKYDVDRTHPIQLDMQHAMSMVTVKIQAADGFPETGTNLVGATTHKFEADPVFTLSSNGFGVSGNAEYAITQGSVNVETGVITPTAGSENTVIAQTLVNDDASWTVIKTALIYPESLLGRTADTDLVANITADGNEYNVTAAKMRAAMLAADAATDYKTKAGYNYIFRIILKKTGITVEASVEKWKDITADEQQGIIRFNADVLSSTISQPAQAADYAALTTAGSSFNLYESATAAGFDSWTSLASPSTVATYASGDWTYAPQLYWKNKSDNEFFRALAQTTSASTDAAPATTAYATNALTQYSDATTGADDVLWGTTAGHTANLVGGTTANYAEGAVINPRTSDVPLMFYHAKSKITVDLTTEGTADDASTKWVDLDDATVTISNLYTTATLKMSDGTLVYPSSKTTAAISGSESSVETGKMTAHTTLDESMVIPQAIANASVVEITLKDGTKYTVQLNTCKNSASPFAPITSWERGVHYIYTFKITKAEITVQASLAKWTEVTSTTNVWF